jgi:hypothetical protein
MGAPDWRTRLWLRARRGSKWIAAVTIMALLLLNFLFTAAYENHTQAAQRRAGELIEEKICTDVGTMAQLAPPAGDPASNPSRAYEQAEHRAWQGLYAGLDCR